MIEIIYIVHPPFVNYIICKLNHYDLHVISTILNFDRHGYSKILAFLDSEIVKFVTCETKIEIGF